MLLLPQQQQQHLNIDSRSILLFRILLGIYILWDIVYSRLWYGKYDVAWYTSFIVPPSGTTTSSENSNNNDNDNDDEIDDEEEYYYDTYPNQYTSYLWPSDTPHDAPIHRIWFYRGSSTTQYILFGITVLILVCWMLLILLPIIINVVSQRQRRQQTTTNDAPFIVDNKILSSPKTKTTSSTHIIVISHYMLSILLWVSITAIQCRNVHIMDPIRDTYLRHLLFWSCFLPQQPTCCGTSSSSSLNHYYYWHYHPRPLEQPQCQPTPSLRSTLVDSCTTTTPTGSQTTTTTTTRRDTASTMPPITASTTPPTTTTTVWYNTWSVYAISIQLVLVYMGMALSAMTTAAVSAAKFSTVATTPAALLWYRWNTRMMTTIISTIGDIVVDVRLLPHWIRALVAVALFVAPSNERLRYWCVLIFSHILPLCILPSSFSSSNSVWWHHTLFLIALVLWLPTCMWERIESMLLSLLSYFGSWRQRNNSAERSTVVHGNPIEDNNAAVAVDDNDDNNDKQPSQAGGRGGLPNNHLAKSDDAIVRETICYPLYQHRKLHVWRRQTRDECSTNVIVMGIQLFFMLYMIYNFAGIQQWIPQHDRGDIGEALQLSQHWNLPPTLKHYQQQQSDVDLYHTAVIIGHLPSNHCSWGTTSKPANGTVGATYSTGSSCSPRRIDILHYIKSRGELRDALRPSAYLYHHHPKQQSTTSRYPAVRWEMALESWSRMSYIRPEDGREYSRPMGYALCTLLNDDMYRQRLDSFVAVEIRFQHVQQRKQRIWQSRWWLTWLSRCIAPFTSLVTTSHYDSTSNDAALLLPRPPKRATVDTVLVVPCQPLPSPHTPNVPSYGQ